MSIIKALAGAAISAGVLCAAPNIAAAIGTTSVQTEAVPEQYYIIKEQEGKIALFLEGSTEPLVVFDIQPSYFGAADNALLKEGIRLKGCREVMRLIEDLELQ